MIVYFSTKSGNTRRFVEKLTDEAIRIPFEADLPIPEVEEPFVLIFPSYGGGHIKGAVPAPVIRFLNNPNNREHLQGIVGTGNTNFGTGYCLGAHIAAEKCGVPLIRKVELFGTPEDVDIVSKEIARHEHYASLT